MGGLRALKGWAGYKRIIVLVAASILMIVLCSLAAPAAGQTQHNYAEAFQKSIYFYDAEKSGPGITGGRLEWRGDSDLADMQVPLEPKGDDGLGTNMSQAFMNANRAVLDPDGNGSMDLSGGMHDAGDHVKFGLPQTYAASTLGWGYYHFKDAFQNINEDEHTLEILKWFSDYFLRSTFRNSSGNVVAFAYQVGEGSVDHTLWAPPELHNLPRPAYFSTAETPATDQTAGAAAALSIMYLNYRDVDAAYANKCLDTAKALYAHAKQYHNPDNPKLGYSGGFYNSSYDEDELSWAAVWLYRATGDQSYITDITAVDATGHYTGWLKRIVASTEDDWQNIWVHSWDTVWGGVFLELAPITDDPQHWYYARWNLEYWSSIPHEDPNDTNFMAETPAGYKVINTWGSNRYNATAQLQTMVYRKYTGRTDFTDWAKTQMDYILGDNPMGYSYEVGYPSPEQSASHPHHRAAHGSMNNSMFDPPTHRHVLWGALVGGPDTTDFYKDEVPEFAYSEVAVDYQAGFVGALAGMYKYYGAGQQPAPSFPPLEKPETAYFLQGKADQDSNERTQFAVRLNAIPTHPPHLVTGLKARYFFNISELAVYGQDISTIDTDILYDEQASSYGGGVEVVGPVAWDAANGIYYVEMDWSDDAIYGKRDFQLAIKASLASDYGYHWDPSNDWSRQGLGTELADTSHIPVYLDGVLVYGQEPGPNQPTTIPPTGVPPTGVPPTGVPPTGVPPTGVPPTGVPPTSVPPTTGPGVCAVNYAVQNQWGSGATVNVTVRNNGSSAIDGWTLTWTYPGNQQINQMWGGSYSQSGASVSVTNISWNRVIPANGGTAGFGMNLTFSGVNNPPTNFALNGTPCNGGPQPTQVPPTSVPPTGVPPTSVPPTSVPPTTVPPTSVPPTSVPPTGVPPTSVPPTSVPPTSGPQTCSVSYVVQNQWGSGATISVTITHNGTSAINGWTLTWTFPGNQQINNLWSGTYTQNGASVSVANAAWNGTIGANGGTVNFGFNITFTGTNTPPGSFSLNGTPCQ